MQNWNTLFLQVNWDKPCEYERKHPLDRLLIINPLVLLSVKLPLTFSYERVSLSKIGSKVSGL